MTATLPLLRWGQVYESAETVDVPSVHGGVAVRLGLANAGLLRRDARKAATARDVLRALPAAELIAATQRAAALFRHGTLPTGGVTQDEPTFVAAVSDTTGLPHALVRANLDKLAYVLGHVDEILAGLLLGVPLEAVDRGVGDFGGIPVGVVQTARSLTAVLPSNSPGVHSLWLPAFALKTPVALKPGSTEPWVSLRLLAALQAAGVPAEAMSWTPAGHDGGDALVETHDRALVFGGPEVARRYAGRAEVSVHGPGYSKVIVGPDADVDEVAPLIADSIARNGGRSCINASTVAVVGDAARADAVASAVATCLAAWAPTALDAPDARLAAWADAERAGRIDASVEARLEGAVDVARAVRGTDRLQHAHGMTWLLPTLVRCGPAHPLARTELMFPFASVVPVAADDLPGWLGPTLVAAVLSDDAALRARIAGSPDVDRLHLGAVPTTTIRWDQPHEGNLFTWLWRRRAVAF
jgi:acyl-CoA reductase-like NAD-dependent aldehyde dehydrogenase